MPLPRPDGRGWRHDEQRPRVQHGDSRQREHPSTQSRIPHDGLCLVGRQLFDEAHEVAPCVRRELNRYGVELTRGVIDFGNSTVPAQTWRSRYVTGVGQRHPEVRVVDLVHAA